MNKDQYLSQLRADAQNILVPDGSTAPPLAIHAYDKFKQSGKREHINDAVELARANVGHIGDYNELLFSQLNQLKVMVDERYEWTNETEHLRETIDVSKQIIDITPADHPNLPNRLWYYAEKLSGLYEQTGDIAELEEAIVLARHGVEISHADGLGLPAGLHLLGNLFTSRYKRKRETSDLEELIIVARQAVDLVSLDDDEAQIIGLNFLRWQLVYRYSEINEKADLKEAIRVLKQEIRLIPVDDDIRQSDRLFCLGNQLWKLYKHTNKTTSLIKAVSTYRQAIDLTSLDHPYREIRLNCFGNRLYYQFKETKDILDLEEAVSISREVADSTPIHDSSRQDKLSVLGHRLCSQFKHTMDISDLEEAILVSREVVNLTPITNINRQRNLRILRDRLDDHFNHTSEIASLEESISLTRQILKDTSQVAADLNTLGNQLESRYIYTKKMADLKEAISISRQVIGLTPDNDPHRASRLHDLGTKLQKRNIRLKDTNNLEEAVSVIRQAIDLKPVDDASQVHFLSSLGLSLSDRHEQTGNLDDYEEAMAVTKQAIDLAPEGHPMRPMLINNFTFIQDQGHEARRGYRSNLETHLQVLDLTPAHAPGRVTYLYTLGAQMSNRFQWDHACGYYKAAWNCKNAEPLLRVEAAAQCLPLLAKFDRIQCAIELGLAVLDLLPAVNTKLLDHRDKQVVMSTFAGIATKTCSYLLKEKRPFHALKCLETGHAVILGQLIDDRNDLSTLRLHHHRVAKRYDRIRRKINKSAASDAGRDCPKSVNWRQNAIADLDACVKEIRTIPGYERFMLSQTEADMKACAVGGTIVVVNMTEYRADAILVTESHVKTIHLPRLLAEDAKSWLGQKWTGREIRRAERPQKNKDYLLYLAWLWDVCVEPILEVVVGSSDSKPDQMARIWWIGTGFGNSMPFHAAGLHTAESTQNAFSKVISSYTTSIKVLAYSRRRASTTRSIKGSLVVATMPTTPAASPASYPAPEERKLCNLPYTLNEGEEIRSLLAGNIPIESLSLPSVSQVIEKLQDCSIAHLACHGLTDHVDPSNSRLVLQKQHDQGLQQDWLTVHQVSKLTLPNAYIAYLSACSTAENSVERLSDEAIHVVSGFQVAGFPHVVGCLWPSIDRICVEVATRFYQTLLKQHNTDITTDEHRVAIAVREAVMAVRETNIRSPLLWAQFVHFGP